MFLYLLQANIAIAFFAILYKFILSSDTLFTLRRTWLLSIVVLSFVVQFMPAMADLNIFNSPEHHITTIYATLTQTTDVAPISSDTQLSTTNILYAIWLLGIALLSIRFISGFFTILKIKYKGRATSINGTKVIVISDELPPFSFNKWIFLSESQLHKEDLHDVITHELTHIRSHHMIDVIISEVLTIILWFNPAAWFIRYAIRENLEFLADRNVLDCGHNRKEYQYHLLKLSYSPCATNIVNYFNVSQLKNRIIMMNKEKTPKKAALKYLLLIPALILLSLTNNAQTKKVEKPKKTEKSEKIIIRGVDATDVLVIVDGKEGSLNDYTPDQIESVTVLKDPTSKAVYGEKGKNGVILVTTKKNHPSSIDLNQVTVVGFGSNTKAKQNSNKQTIKTDTLITIKGYRDNDEQKVRMTIGENPPLYILGDKEITFKEFRNLDLNDIDAISVLKDDNATKVYGDKGKNGVIIITLKK